MKRFIIEHVDPVGTAIIGLILSSLLDTVWLKPGPNDFWTCRNIWITVIMAGGLMLWALILWEKRMERQMQIKAERSRHLMLQHGQAIQETGLPAPWHE